ncbi:hypothetical protein PFISCL1PPCAC_15563, partial [Pristionchus fissidentatus]
SLTVKDLGVIFTPSLSFSKHIEKIISKARSKLYLLFNSFRSNTTDVYLKSFTTYILPGLETCSVIWNPVHAVEITMEIEKVQRDFTRKLYYRCSLPHTSYRNRLRALNLVTLERRRVITDIVFLHSTLHRKYELDYSSLLTLSPLTRFIRNSHPFRISLPFLPHNSHSTFASRTITIWNSLPYNPSHFSLNPLLKIGSDPPPPPPPLQYPCCQSKTTDSTTSTDIRLLPPIHKI